MGGCVIGSPVFNRSLSRRFKNDTEQLEKLCELHTKMTAQKQGVK
jgi:hypothetical protein